jgi:4-amino-4-deoxy-L-arabinose transferase-like glycosyltransferase
VNAFFGAATVLVVYALASRVVDRRVGLVAAAVMALFPSQVFFSTVLMTESVFVFLVALLLLLAVLWMVDTRPVNWQLVALGVLLGSMTLVRAEAMLLVPALVVLWKVLAPSWRELGRWMALVLIGVLPVLLLWSVRNYVQVGDLELRSGGGTALRMGVSPDFDFQLTAAYIAAEPPSLADSARHYATHPWDVAWVPARKLAYLFASDSDAVLFVNQHVPPPLSPEAEGRWMGAVNSYYYTVGALAAVGIAAWVARLDKRRLVLLWFLGTWGAIFLLFVPQGRYHFPLTPVLATVAGFTLVRAWLLLRAGGLARISPRIVPGRSVAAFAAFLTLVFALTVIIVQGFPDPVARVRDARRQFDILALGDAVTAYHQDVGSFPSTGGVEEVETFCASPGERACEFRQKFLEVWAEARFRIDPLGEPGTNGYWYASDGETAVLYALRETDSDWAGPRCPIHPPALADKGDLQCIQLPSTPPATSRARS